MNSSFTDKHRRLGLPESYLYFNAGVLLINLDYWRSHDVMNRLMIWMGQYRTRIVAHDQDLLNAVLSKEVTYLSHRWNMQEGMLRRRRHTLPSSESTIDQEMKQPAIIHFAGKHKPWQEKCINPYKPMWERYTDMSPWRTAFMPIPISTSAHHTVTAISLSPTSPVRMSFRSVPSLTLITPIVHYWPSLQRE